MWLWVKNRCPKRTPDKWKHGLKPALPWRFNVDPYPCESSHRLEPRVKRLELTELQNSGYQGVRMPNAAPLISQFVQMFSRNLRDAREGTPGGSTVCQHKAGNVPPPAFPQKSKKQVQKVRIRRLESTYRKQGPSSISRHLEDLVRAVESAVDSVAVQWAAGVANVSSPTFHLR